MRNDKNDRRSIDTIGKVKQSLLELLKSKPLNKISVIELCGKANINRATFYTHFFDIYDVYESIENDICMEVKSKLENIEITTLNKDFFLGILNLISDNAEFVKLIMLKATNWGFVDKMLTLAKEQIIGATPQLSKVFSYMSGGSIGVIFDWVYADMKEPMNSVANTLAQITSALLDNFTKLV